MAFRSSIAFLASITLLAASAALFSQQPAAQQKAAPKGNSLIRRLADVEADLKGKLERIKVHGKLLEGNLEGDSPDREVFVYLPESYAKEPNRRYPALYLLHGYGLHAEQWVGFTNTAQAETEFAAGNTKEMIIVMPDAFTLHNGSFYSTSATTGDWENFIAKELVAYVDSHYRTLANRASRGLAGHSMGGYGTFRIAMHHPDVFAAIYPMSACCGYQNAVAPNAAQLEGISKEDALKLPFNQKTPLALGAAWSANPAKAPLFLDLPSKDGKPRNAVLAKWMANSTLVMLDDHAGALKQLKAIQFDVGLQDGLLGTNQDMDEALSAAGVPHTFLTYEGDHNGKVAERFAKHVLPFFSQNLVFPAVKK